LDFKIYSIGFLFSFNWDLFIGLFISRSFNHIFIIKKINNNQSQRNSHILLFFEEKKRQTLSNNWNYLGKFIGSCVPASNIVKHLAFNVTKQRTSPDAEQFVCGPFIAQLLLHQRKPNARVLGRLNPA